MKCEDMKLFVFEWVILNPKAGKDIKYVRQLNKQELIKVLLYVEGKLSKEVLMEEVIIPKKMYFSEIARIRLLKKKGEYDEDADDADDADDEDADDDSDDTDTDDDTDDDTDVDTDDDKE